ARSSGGGAGVVPDVAAMLAAGCRPAGFVVTPDQLDECSRRAGVEISPGDAVLVRTGWAAMWDSDPSRYHREEPGVGWEGAHWLTERRVSIVGSDNWSFEPIPFEAGDR